MTRQIILDTETTGIDPKEGHRIIEIGCVEMINRRMTGNNYHQYLQPDREIDEEAIEVHGITPEFLADKPRFHDVMEEFAAYVKGAELIIHNASFDVGFLDHEFVLAGSNYRINNMCGVLDTLVMARDMYPGQRNSLDALCKRYFIDNSHRELHGALLDSEILGDVYLAMTGGQVALSWGDQTDGGSAKNVSEIRRIAQDKLPLKVIKATEDELSAHSERLEAVEKAGGKVLWNEMFQ